MLIRVSDSAFAALRFLRKIKKAALEVRLALLANLDSRLLCSRLPLSCLVRGVPQWRRAGI